MSEPLYRDEEWLHDQYVNKHKSRTEIADLCGVKRTTIGNWIRKFGIKRKYRDKEWLREQYVEKEKSQTEIAESCEVTRHAIGNAIRKYEIERDCKYKKEKWLREQYRDLSRSSIEIADQCDVHPATICKWIDRHGIEARSDKEQAENYYEKNEPTVLRDKGWLESKYIEDDLTTYEIANKCDVTRMTVTYWLEKHNIPIDDPSPSSWGDIEKLEDEDWLRDQYVERQKDTPEIADSINVASTTVGVWMEKHGIDRRDQSGQNSRFWRGGSERYYGPRWDHQREKALRRDQYRCQRCGMIDPDHQDLYQRGLNVHHKIPYREFTEDKEAHRLDNLISLCVSCHMIVEYDDEQAAELQQ